MRASAPRQSIAATRADTFVLPTGRTNIPQCYFLSAGGVMMTVSPPGLPGAPFSPCGPGTPAAGAPFSPCGPGGPEGPCAPLPGVGTGTTVVSFFSHPLTASAMNSAAVTMDNRMTVPLMLKITNETAHLHPTPTLLPCALLQTAQVHATLMGDTRYVANQASSKAYDP